MVCIGPPNGHKRIQKKGLERMEKVIVTSAMDYISHDH